MKRLLAMLLALVIAACASAAPPVAAPGARRSIDIAAEQWVRLALAIDMHEEGYVDAYFGPGAWREDARAEAASIATLRDRASHIAELLHSVENDTDAESRARARYLLASVASAAFRLDMIEGARAPFQDEAERLFALRPNLRSLESYDAALTRIEALVPGPGSLSERVDAFRARYSIPAGQLRAVLDRAIAECRARTLAHYALPENERFDMELVTGQSWGAYNWYQGDNRSLIQINTDRPLQIGSALTYGCHEGYPGHHVQGIYNEQLYRTRGWVEYAVAPLYAPSSPMAEGAGNYGVELAFPNDERLVFERDVLFPLAGLDPATAGAYARMRTALAELSGVGNTIVAQFLAGEIDRERTIALKQRYELVPRAQAEQSLRFAEQYRSYVINYNIGEQLVRAYVERAGADPAARWAAFERIMTQPTLPQDLAP